MAKKSSTSFNVNVVHAGMMVVEQFGLVFWLEVDLTLLVASHKKHELVPLAFLDWGEPETDWQLQRDLLNVDLNIQQLAHPFLQEHFSSFK